MTRGIRNHNPGNIKDFGIPWEGLARWSEMTPEQQAEGVFCVFRRPWWGIRAIAVTLRTYQVKRNLKTVRQIINRWAPHSENPTGNYVNYVSSRLDAGPDDPINVLRYRTMRALVQAIVAFENGQDPYTWEYDTGLILMGIEPPAD